MRSLTLDQKRLMRLCFKELEARGNAKEREEGGQISLHALEGHPSKKVIKIKGAVGKKKLVVLIDSRSTHSFLDEGAPRNYNAYYRPPFPY